MNKTIRVTGVGNVSLPPDITVITVNTKNFEINYNKAVNRASMNLNNMKESLYDIGIAKNSIKTTSYSVENKYESYKDKEGNYQSRFVGYEVHQTFKFSFDINNELLGEVLMVLNSLSRYNISVNINYAIKDEQSAKNLLLANAVKDGMSKANILASSANVVLGDLISIDYSFLNVEFSSPLRMMDCDINYDCIEAPGLNMDIDPEDIHRSDNVTLTYEIK